MDLVKSNVVGNFIPVTVKISCSSGYESDG